LIAYILLKLYKQMLDPKNTIRLKDLMVTLKTGIFSRPNMMQNRQRYRKKRFEGQQELWGVPA
jgi:hypothetical protein